MERWERSACGDEWVLGGLRRTGGSLQCVWPYYCNLVRTLLALANWIIVFCGNDVHCRYRAFACHFFCPPSLDRIMRLAASLTYFWSHHLNIFFVHIYDLCPRTSRGWSDSQFFEKPIDCSVLYHHWQLTLFNQLPVVPHSPFSVMCVAKRVSAISWAKNKTYLEGCRSNFNKTHGKIITFMNFEEWGEEMF